MPFIIKCIGGPAAGVRYTNRLEDYGLSWPLPDVLPGLSSGSGKYVKVSESSLPPEAAQRPGVGVGAEFHWQEGEDD